MKRFKEAEVVEIDGVPPSISPKLIEAIRATKVFFKHHANDVILPHCFDNEEDNDSMPGIPSRRKLQQQDVVASIMGRVEEAKELEALKKEEKRRETASLAIYDWLGALTRNKYSKGDKRPPAVACLKYVWKLQEHNRPTVRRMSLHLCGSLILKNEDCRDRWQDNLLDWISSVVELKQKGVAEKNVNEVLVWQKESMAWVSELMERFPDNNKFRVAHMFLEQKGPSLHVEGGDAGKTMADWRQIRDLCLKHGEKQCEIVEKLIKRAYSCIDVLMPRLANSDEAGDKAEEKTDDDEDDDDDIDWEEGDEAVAAEVHAAAVEETLALMQTTGGLRGGDIEINLDGGVDSDRNDRAKKRLQKTITSLSTRHLPCLSTWVNGMSEADNLSLQNGSLVAMSQQDAVVRQHLLRRLMAVKRAVASVLSAASRLEIKAEAAQINIATQRNDFKTNVPQRHLGLARTIEVRRRGPSTMVTGRRSNRIRIKFGKK